MALVAARTDARAAAAVAAPARPQARGSTPLRLAPPPPRIAPDDARQPSGVEVRLHSPIPQVVIVRVAGTLDEPGVALLVERVGQQFDRAAHVVLDLVELPSVEPVVDVLADLHRAATTHDATLYITGADPEALSHPLRAAGMDQLPVMAPSADTVIALLHHAVAITPRGARSQPADDPPRWSP